MKFTIPDRAPGASFSSSSLSSILAKRSNGVLEYWSTGIPRRGKLHPLRRIESGQMVRSGDAACRFPRLTLRLVRELVRPL